MLILPKATCCNWSPWQIRILPSNIPCRFDVHDSPLLIPLFEWLFARLCRCRCWYTPVCKGRALKWRLSCCAPWLFAVNTVNTWAPFTSIAYIHRTSKSIFDNVPEWGYFDIRSLIFDFWGLLICKGDLCRYKFCKTPWVEEEICQAWKAWGDGSSLLSIY